MSLFNHLADAGFTGLMFAVAAVMLPSLLLMGTVWGSAYAGVATTLAKEIPTPRRMSLEHQRDDLQKLLPITGTLIVLDIFFLIYLFGKIWN